MFHGIDTVFLHQTAANALINRAKERLKFLFHALVY